MSHWAAPSRRSELAGALKGAVRKPLDEVFRKRDRSDQTDFKILAEVAEDLEKNSWEKRHYNTALSDAVRRATQKMPEDGPRVYSTMPWCEIAATLCGFEHLEEVAQVDTNKLYNRRYEVVKRRSEGLAEISAFKDEVIERTWPKLADALASLKPYSSNPSIARAHGELLQQIASRTLRRHPLILYVGTDLPNFLTKIPQGEDALRALIQAKAVHTVIAHACDLSLLFGDLLPTYYTRPSANDHALWQLDADSPSDELLSYFRSFTSTGERVPPTIVTTGLTPEQEQAWQVVADGALDDVALLHSRQQVPNLSTLLNIATSLAEVVSPYSLALASKRLDFDEPYGLDDVLAGQTVKPGIVKTGFWPRSTRDRIKGHERRSVEIIRGPSGVGKTSVAYLMAFTFSPDAAYYLDLNQFAEVTFPELVKLVEWFEGNRVGASLIIDNVQTAKTAVDQLSTILARRKNFVHVLLVETTGVPSFELLAGTKQDSSEIDIYWEVGNQAISDWVAQRLPSLRGTASRASSEATSLWHFFHILRGGSTSLEAEISLACSNNLSEIAWFAVAASQVFTSNSAPTVRALVDLVDQLQLWPLHIPEDEHVPWLIHALSKLLDQRFIVAGLDGLTCRHPLEAIEVVRLCCKRDSQLTTQSYLHATNELFVKALEPIRLPSKLRDEPQRLGKSDFNEFVGKHLGRTIARQLALESALLPSPTFQRHIDAVWSDLVLAMEEWPVRNLYWMLTRPEFGALIDFSFSPFLTLRKLDALVSWSGDGDCLEAVFAIQCLIAQDALQEVQRLARQVFLSHALSDIYGRLLDLWNWSGDEPTPRSGGELDDRRYQCVVDARRAAGLNNKILQPDIHLNSEHVGDLRRLVARDLRSVKLLIAQTNGTVLSRRLAQVPTAVYRTGHEYAIALTASWLVRISGVFRNVARSVDQDLLLEILSTCRACRVMFIAHYWFLSQEQGLALVRLLPAAWKQEIFLRVAKENEKAESDVSRRSTILRMDASDLTIPLFVSSIAPEVPELEEWLSSESSGKLGHMVRVVRSLEDRLGYSLT